MYAKPLLFHNTNQNKTKGVKNFFLPVICFGIEIGQCAGVSVHKCNTVAPRRTITLGASAAFAHSHSLQRPQGCSGNMASGMEKKDVCIHVWVGDMVNHASV